MDSHQIQFILKSMMGLVLATLITLSCLPYPAYSSPIQNQNQASFQPLKPSVNNQYKPKSPSFVRSDTVQLQQDDAYKTYNPSVVMQYQQLTKNGAEIVNVRPSRRTILSTLMQPFVSMREQAMNMLAVSLQGCNSGNQSMWCRFWGMFLK